MQTTNRRTFEMVKCNPFYLNAAFAALLMSSPAFSQEVGKATRIVNSVSGKYGNIKRKLATNDTVFSSEKISASPDSHGEIRLNDNSRIIVGAGSEISLDDFLVSDNGFASGTLNVAKGAFRFLSGKSAKGTFKIITPLATIGIRGTVFDVYVKNGGVTDVILFSGRVEVCTRLGSCRTISKGCDIIHVSESNRISSKNFLRSGNRKEENDEYSLVSNQLRFPFGWHASTGACDLRASIESIDSPDADPDPDSCSGPYC